MSLTVEKYCKTIFYKANLAGEVVAHAIGGQNYLTATGKTRQEAYNRIKDFKAFSYYPEFTPAESASLISLYIKYPPFTTETDFGSGFDGWELPLFALEGWDLVKLEQGTILKECYYFPIHYGYAKSLGHSFVLTPKGKEYIRALKNAKLSDSCVDLGFPETVQDIIFGCLTQNLNVNTPWVSQLLEVGLFEIIGGKCSITERGIEYFVQMTHPRMLVAFLSNPDANISHLIGHIPYENWSFLLPLLKNKMPKQRFEAIVSELQKTN